MIPCLRHLLGWMVSAFCCREHLVLENLALRQQLLALHVERPRRRLTVSHKLFWIALRSLWSGWKKPLVLLHRGRLSIGIGPASASTGNGAPGPSAWAAGNLPA